MSILMNAAALLRCFGPDCPDLTVSDAVRRLSMPKANASRLMRSMRDAGMLETIGSTHRHRPGSLLLDVASLYQRSSSLIQRAGATVATVSEVFGHTGYVSIRDGQEVTAVVDCEGTNTLRVISSIGRRLPAHLSATGRSLLARMSDAEVLELYAGHSAAPTLLDRLGVVRRDGYALSSEETTPGVDAIAIAVGDPGTGETLSLCIAYPHGHVPTEGRDDMIAALIHAAGELASDIGDVDFGLRQTNKRKIS